MAFTVNFYFVNGFTQIDDMFHGDIYFHSASFGVPSCGDFALLGPIKKINYGKWQSLGLTNQGCRSSVSSRDV